MKKKDKSGWINPFGTPLEAQEQISTGDLLGPAACTIPIFVHRAFEFFRKFNGLEKEGIFRISGRHNAVNTMKEQFSKGQRTDFNKDDNPYDVASLFKQYLRELPTPLLTYECYDCFIAVQGIPEEFKEHKINSIVKVLQMLPRSHLAVLMKLCEFMQEALKFTDQNKMTAQNLAICLAPNILRNDNETLSNILQDSGFANALIQTLFLNTKEIFSQMKTGQMKNNENKEETKGQETPRLEKIENKDTQEVVFTPTDPLSLADWRRQVSDVYSKIRADSKGSKGTWDQFINTRNNLFKNHLHSPLTSQQKKEFKGLQYYDYDPKYRVVAKLKSAPKQYFKVMLASDGQFTFTRVGKLYFELPGGKCELNLYWVNGYGGGLFLPFRDQTNGKETFGGGRYLLDAIMGADFGSDSEKQEVILDFNYAYNPFSAYNSSWTSPLALSENNLNTEIKAGEKSNTLAVV